MSIALKCKIDGCMPAKGRVKRGYCDRHYQNLRRRGILGNLPPRRPATCSIKDCRFLLFKDRAGKRTIVVNGFCQNHNSRYSRGLDINRSTSFDPRPAIIDGDIAKIPLGVNAKDGYAIVDKEFAWLDKYKWGVNAMGYAIRGGSPSGVFTHREVMGIVKGFNDKVIDHANRVVTDNRKSNLRVVTHRENSMNRKQRGDIKYKGVSKHRNGLYRAGIYLDGECNDLGLYRSEKEAALAYDKAAKETFGEFAYLNFRKENV